MSSSAILRSLLRAGDHFIDIGARNGIAATLVAASIVGPAGSVTALEPDESHFRRLRHNIAEQQFTQVRCLKGTLRETASTLRLVRPHLIRINEPAFGSAEMASIYAAFCLSGSPIIIIEMAGVRQDSWSVDEDDVTEFCSDHGYKVERLQTCLRLTRIAVATNAGSVMVRPNRILQPCA